MSQLRILSVIFDTHLDPWEISKFRGAMIKKVGQEHDWFHNHRVGENAPSFHYRYPLIQYKLDKNNPMLLCIDQGIEEAQYFFSQPDWSMNIGQKTHDMRIKKLNVNQFDMKLLETKKEYRIHNWLALNQEAFLPYKNTERLSDKILILENVLTSHILGFATGIGWEIPGKIEISITELLGEPRYTSYKDAKHLAFNLHFKTNVFLPNFIGLGKGSTLGFGVVKQNHDFKK